MPMPTHPVRTRPIAPEPDAIYTCPMHPQIRCNAPGTCPICGMSLEPVRPIAVEIGPSAELRDMTTRFWIGAALTLPLLLLEMGGHLSMNLPRRLVSPSLSLWIQF